MRALGPVLLFFCLAVVPAARAQSADAINAAVESEARERVASERIVLGVLDGRIDEREARRLNRLVESLQRYQVGAYADDVLSPRERARLEFMQTRIDRAIARALAH